MKVKAKSEVKYKLSVSEAELDQILNGLLNNREYLNELLNELMDEDEDEADEIFGKLMLIGSMVDDIAEGVYGNTY